MKKSLARVKQQLADQLRPGKTDVLSEELQAADKRVEYLREILQSLTKALPLPSNGDKRTKKGPDYHIYSTLKNEKLINNEEGYGELVQPIFAKYCEMFYSLSEEYSNYELEVDKNVSIPLHKLLETDIIKLKKNLNKYVSDRDTANNRLQTAQNRHSEFNKHHTADPTSKLSSLQEDVEEAGQKVEQASDQLAHDMFTLLAKEPEISNYILLHIKLRRQYYENSLDVLNRLIPNIENLINNSEVRPVFNCPLVDHLRVTKRKIALPIELCVCAIMEHGITEEGLFRVAGGASKLRRLKLSIDANCLTLPLPAEYKDIHLFAGVLKSYLRELPEPLLTLTQHSDWLAASRITDEEQRIKKIKNILENLPKENYDNLKYLIKFLSELSKNPENKMSSHNIAIVMAPNLLWSGRQDPDLDEIACTSKAVDTLVSYADVLFPGETNFYLTYKRGEIFKTKPVISYQSQTYSHVRNSSNDTGLINVDINFENYSPKPLARRKNKPAPEPPQTNRNAKIEHQSVERRKSVDLDHVPKKDHQVFSKEDIGQPKLISQTLVTTPVKDIAVEPPPPPAITVAASTVAITASTAAITASSASVNKVNAQNVTVGKIVQQPPPASQTIQRPANRPPVAAPRLSLADQSTKTDDNKMVKSLNDMKEVNESDEVVEFRKPVKIDHETERGNKPMIPERPASLRPASFRLTRPQATQDLVKADQYQTLEKTVVYNVSDKQQVAFLRHPIGHDVQIHEKEKFLGHQPSTVTEQTENSKEDDVKNEVSDDVASTFSLQRRRSVGAKPVRPPKPSDVTMKTSTEKINLTAKSNERLNIANNNLASSSPTHEMSKSHNEKIIKPSPSHTRTMSEGNIIDNFDNSIFNNSADRNRPSSPTKCVISASRPPRPQPPPPPPPVVAAVKVRSSTESTDL